MIDTGVHTKIYSKKIFSETKHLFPGCFQKGYLPPRAQDRSADHHLHKILQVTQKRGLVHFWCNFLSLEKAGSHPPQTKKGSLSASFSAESEGDVINLVSL